MMDTTDKSRGVDGGIEALVPDGSQQPCPYDDERFLCLLDPDADNWHFRTIDEKGSSGARSYVGTLAKVRPDLQLENGKGRGVFFVVNPGGQKKAEIASVRAVFADFDGVELPEFPLEPHAIVESSPGKYHVYWLVSGLELDHFSPVQRSIAAMFGSDPAVHDLSRLMRLPGFLHHKGEPFGTRVIHEAGVPPYSAEAILRSFPPVSPSGTGAEQNRASAGVVVDKDRHADLLPLSWSAARLVTQHGVAYDTALDVLFAEAARDRWTRDMSAAEIRRAFDGALAKQYAMGLPPAGNIIANTLPPPSRRTLKFRRADELIANPKPLSWLIRGVLELDSFCLIFGDPGVGKSFLALDIAPSVATGTAWQGHAVTPGPVFYIAGEGGNGLGRRLRAWEIGRGVSLAGAPLHVSTMPASLTDEQSAAEAVEVVNQMSAQHGAPKLIVLDTVARNFGPGDENSTKDMTAFVAACDVLRERTGACVLLVHHSGHGDKTRARGSMALKGALDWEYGMTHRHGAIVVHCTKAKDAEPPANKAFRLESIDLGLVDEDGEAVTSAVLQPADFMPPLKMGKAGRGKNQTLALDQLKRGIKECNEHFSAIDEDDEPWMGLTAWRDRCAAAGLDNKRFSEAKKSLSAQGFVRIDGERVTIQDPEFHVI